MSYFEHQINDCATERTAPASAGSFSELDAFTLGELEQAFTGQKILPDGRPNRPRLAMRWAQAMVRAVAVGDIVIAEICRRGMNRAHAPKLAAGGSKE